ncbi:MAG: Crp/Fnr family transcriptional regulator [Eubacterium sp.]|nr:Crp/Fnr family transcriptional regulator [Eubacterium sp.]
MNTAFLSETVLFKGMSENEISSALDALRAKEKTFKKGDSVMLSGKTTPYMGLVTLGCVTIEVNDIWGNRSILSRAEKGEFFAETYALLENEPMLVDVIATKDSNILLLRIGSLKNLLANQSSWSVKLISNILMISSQKNLLLASRSYHTSQKGIRGRVMAYLNTVSLKNGSREFNIPFDRQQLADYLNVERTALSKELAKMQKDGLISFRKNHFSIMT